MIKGLLRGLMKWLFKVEVESQANFKNERTLIIANHQSFIDGLLIGLFLPVRATFVVHSTVLNNKFFKFVLSFVDYLPVDTANPMAMKRVAELIKSGKPVVIFPEGRITTTGNLMKIYEGSGFIAFRTDATIIPVYIDGALNTKFSRKGHKQPRKFFSPVKISIGQEQKIQVDETLMAKEKRKKAGERMRRILQENMFKFQPKETLFQRLLRVKSLYGKNAPIIIDKDQLLDRAIKPLNYSGFLQRVFGMGHLVSKFTEENEVLGVLLPNVAITPAVIFGLNVYNRTPAMLNYTLGVQGLQLACETAQIKHILTSKAFIEAAKLSHLVEGLKNVKIVYLEDLRESMGLKDKLTILWNKTFPKKFANTQKPEDTAVILFTSGSEAAPKGVVLSNRALLANVDQCRTVIDLNPEDKVLNSLPLFHSFGLTGGTLLPLLSGTPTILYPSPLHYKVIPEVAYEHQCSVIFGTNTFLGKYGANAHPYDFTKMRYVVAGAEKLSDEVRNLWFEKFGIRIFEGYGSTECAPVISVNTPVACKFGSVGLIMPGLTYKLNPVEGVDKGGEFWVKGENLMTGYMLHSAPCKVTFPGSDGWYNTGDIVFVDNDDFLFIQGRMKRFIKVAGEMVSLEVVEKIARQADPKGTHAASSKPDPAKGEMAVLFTTNKDLERGLLVKAAKDLGISELMVAKQIYYVDTIPLLGTGKTDYVALKNLAQD